MCRIKDRLKAHIVKQGDCWLWRSAIGKNRYGTLRVNGATRVAHRVSWEVHNRRKIPHGLILLHSCDTKACINPKHLKPGTYWKNTQEARQRNLLCCGDRNRSSKLTAERALEIRRRYKSGVSMRSMAIEYGVGVNAIYNVVNKYTWKNPIVTSCVDAIGTYSI